MTDPRPLMKVDDRLRPLLMEADRTAVSAAVTGWRQAGLTARVVRGRKMRTIRGLMDEFAAALQFPLYFGENEDAFDECIRELEGLAPAAGFVVTITDPDKVLRDDSDDALRWLVRSLAHAAEEWGRPVDLGEWWDRPAVPFHVVLAGESSTLETAERHWAKAGASLAHFR